MGGIAYSYLRFSTPEQSRGDSRRRQTAMAESYAKRHGLQLDAALNFRDLGISAFRSKNARQGGLRDFLNAVEYSLVPPESILLIESLDRLSRAEVLEAQALFLQIINAGITIVTLIDERSYSKNSLNSNPVDLLISLIIMMRANDESATKSKRLRAAVAANRDDPASRYHGGQCPAWLRPNASRNGYEVIPERAAIICRIFAEAMAGRGLQTITRDLNADGTPMLGRGNQRGKLWQRALIRHILYTPTVIGDYTPHRGEMVNGQLRFVPTVTKHGYYPAVIDLADWDFLQQRRRAWSEHYKCGVRSTVLVANVISRLAKCPRCGRPMVLLRDEDPNHRYLVCMAWREARRCSNEWVRYPEIEDVFLFDIDHLIRACPEPVLSAVARTARLKHIKGKLSHLRQRLASEEAAHQSLAQSGRAGRRWREETEREIDELKSERYRLRLDRNYWKDATLALKLDALRSAVQALPRNLALVNERLRLLLSKVVVDWENEQLVLHWRHGGQTTRGFYRRRLRGTARNATPLVDAASLRMRRAGVWPPPPGETEPDEIVDGDIVSVRLLGLPETRMQVDVSDWEKVKASHGARWTPSKEGGFVVSRQRGYNRSADEPRTVVLARIISGAGPETVVTYDDGNRLNLRSANLLTMAKAEFARRIFHARLFNR